MTKAPEKSLPPDFDLATYLSSKRIVPGFGNPGSKLWLFGEAPGLNEHEKRIPFVGPSGSELAKMCRHGGFILDDIFRNNIVPFRPPYNKLYELDVPLKVFYPSVKEQIAKFRPNCIIAAGGVALRALTGQDKITKRRGSILECSLVPGIKVIGMVHPAELFKDWTLRTLMIHDLTRAFQQSEFPEFKLPQRVLIVKPTFQQVVDAFEQLKESLLLCIDIETRESRISCIGISNSKDWAICIPLEGKDRRSYWSAAEEVEIFKMLSLLISNPHSAKVLQNASFDASFLHQYGLPIQGEIWDTMWMHNLLWPELAHGLDVLTSIYTLEPYYKDEGKNWEPWMGEEALWIYNCKDVTCTMECFHALLQELKEKNLLDFYKLHYQRLQHPLISGQLMGFRIHENRRRRMRRAWEAKVIRESAKLPSPYGKEVNVNSPKQMAWLIYEVLKLPEIRDRKTGALTTGEDALIKLFVKSQDPVLKQIMEVRGLRKFLSSYLNVEIDKDERIRCSYGHTDFGRLKASKFLDSTGTNLQTIPEVGRAFFIAD